VLPVAIEIADEALLDDDGGKRDDEITVGFDGAFNGLAPTIEVACEGRAMVGATLVVVAGVGAIGVAVAGVVVTAATGFGGVTTANGDDSK
jgi:hypothetical protein